MHKLNTTVIALALLALGPSSQSRASVPASAPPYEPPPEALAEGLPGGLTPQGEDDLRRTRDELYGRQLSAEQHAEILSWQPASVDWWLDPVEDLERFRKYHRALALTNNPYFTATQAVVDGFGDAFGLDVLPSPAAAGNSGNAGLLRLSGKLRPDHFHLSFLIRSYLQELLGADLELAFQAYDHAESPPATGKVVLMADVAREVLHRVGRIESLPWEPAETSEPKKLSEADLEAFESWLFDVVELLYPDRRPIEERLYEMFNAVVERNARLAAFQGDDFYAEYERLAGESSIARYHEERAQVLALLDRMAPEWSSHFVEFLGTDYLAAYEEVMTINDSDAIETAIQAADQELRSHQLPPASAFSGPPLVRPDFMVGGITLRLRNQRGFSHQMQLKKDEKQSDVVYHPGGSLPTPAKVYFVQPQCRLGNDCSWVPDFAAWEGGGDAVARWLNFMLSVELRWKGRVSFPADPAVSDYVEQDATQGKLRGDGLVDWNRQAQARQSPRFLLSRTGTWRGHWHNFFETRLKLSTSFTVTDSNNRSYTTSVGASGSGSGPLTVGIQVTETVAWIFTRSVSWSISPRAYEKTLDPSNDGGDVEITCTSSAPPSAPGKTAPASQQEARTRPWPPRGLSLKSANPQDCFCNGDVCLACDAETMHLDAETSQCACNESTDPDDPVISITDDDGQVVDCIPHSELRFGGPGPNIEETILDQIPWRGTTLDPAWGICFYRCYSYSVAIENPETGITTIEPQYRCLTTCFAGLNKLEQRDGRTRLATNRGLGWEPGPWDGFPQEPIEWHPPIDLLAVFGPCHTVDGIQVTECEDSGGGGGGGTGGGAGAGDGPDLQVTLLRLLDPGLIEGDPVQLTTVLHNTGTATAVNSELEVAYQLPSGETRAQRLWTGSLAPGQSRSFDVRSDANAVAPYLATPGAHRVTVTADHLDDVFEVLEDNNQRSLDFQVESGQSAGADLRVAGLSLEPSNPAAPQQVTLHFAIENVGLEPAPASTYRVAVSPPPGGEPAELEQSLGALGAGDRSEHALVIDSTVAGGYAVSVQADVHGDATESDEGNNTRTRTFTVNPDGDCLPCTSGAPDNQVGDRQCHDPTEGDPSQGLVWQCYGVRFDGSSCVASGNHPNGWDAIGPRCPDPATLCDQEMHPDLCGNPGICPGTGSCNP